MTGSFQSTASRLVVPFGPGPGLFARVVGIGVLIVLAAIGLVVGLIVLAVAIPLGLIGAAVLGIRRMIRRAYEPNGMLDGRENVRVIIRERD